MGSAARWGCYQKGLNRKEDLQPGRCKRTDGKKWRCSREAHRESTYCERHMQRGRNSSRKPMTLSITTSTTSPVMKIHSNSVHDRPFIQTIHPASFYSLSSSRHQNSSTQQPFLESGSSYQTNKDNRFVFMTKITKASTKYQRHNYGKSRLLFVFNLIHVGLYKV